MDNDAISPEESFHNCFFYFLKALDVMTLDAPYQCQVMGDYNVAWEIQHDALDGGNSLINWPVDYLKEIEKDAIVQILEVLRKLPEGALTSDNGLAMQHPAWSGLRLLATQVIEQLADAVSRNKAFFENQAARQ